MGRDVQRDRAQDLDVVRWRREGGQALLICGISVLWMPGSQQEGKHPDSRAAEMLFQLVRSRAWEWDSGKWEGFGAVQACLDPNPIPV